MALDPELEAALRVGMGPAWWAARDPGRTSVLAPTGDRSFGELNGNANRLVRALRHRGLRAGDSVALLCSNRAEFAEVYAATARAGLRLTPVNWHLTPAESSYIVGNCGARALVVDAAHGNAVGDIGAAVNVRLSIGGSIHGFEPYETFLDGHSGADIDDPELGTSMLYTSGTTGRPKGVDKAADPDSLIAAVSIYGYQPGDVHLCTGPLYHSAPFAVALVPPINCGVPIVMMRTWDAEETLASIDRHRVTHLHLVPTMFHRLLALPPAVRVRYDLSSLRGVVHGAAPCPVEVKRAMIEWWGPVIHEYYAATEGYGTGVDSRTWLERPGTVGRVDPGHLYVGDERGERLPAGTTGLVWIGAAGRQRFEYHGDPEKTAAAYCGEFFTLGDVGHVDGDGFLFLTDRAADLIISGGVNIYPAEVDMVLLTHPAIADACVLGVPDEEWGERVLALVELRPGATASAEELIDWCRSRLAHFKCPREVEYVDELPRDQNGKLYKRRLRDHYRARASSRTGHEAENPGGTGDPVLIGRPSDGGPGDR